MSARRSPLRTEPRRRSERSTAHVALRVGIAVLFAAIVGAACSLEGDEEAQIIGDVQYDLLGTSTSTTSTTVAERPSFPVTFYWHTAGDNRLRTITRVRDESPSPGQTLTELVAGPLPEDIEENPDLLSRLDQSMQPILTQVDGGEFQIQIVWGAEEDLSIEQAAEFVCTATQFSNIEAITIVNGEGIPFTLSGVGAVPIEGPARPSDFGGCVEEPAPGDTVPDTEDADGGTAATESTTTSP